MNSLGSPGWLQTRRPLISISPSKSELLCGKELDHTQTQKTFKMKTICHSHLASHRAFCWQSVPGLCVPQGTCPQEATALEPDGAGAFQLFRGTLGFCSWDIFLQLLCASLCPSIRCPMSPPEDLISKTQGDSTHHSALLPSWHWLHSESLFDFCLSPMQIENRLEAA